MDSAKNLSEGKLNKQSANSILDIFKQREEERQKEIAEKAQAEKIKIVYHLKTKDDSTEDSKS